MIEPPSLKRGRAATFGKQAIPESFRPGHHAGLWPRPTAVPARCALPAAKAVRAACAARSSAAASKKRMAAQSTMRTASIEQVNDDRHRSRTGCNHAHKKRRFEDPKQRHATPWSGGYLLRVNPLIDETGKRTGPHFLPPLARGGWGGLYPAQHQSLRSHRGFIDCPIVTSSVAISPSDPPNPPLPRGGRIQHGQREIRPDPVSAVALICSATAAGPNSPTGPPRF